MKRLVRFAAFAPLLLPGVALAAGAPQTFKDLANDIVQVLNNATTDLIVLAIVIYFYGVSTSLFKGEKGRENLRQQMIWGVAVIFLAVSIWGVIQLLQNTFFNLGGSGTTSTGGSGQNCTNLNCQFGAQP